MTRLNLIFNKNQKWNHKKSPLLSDYLNEYKLNRQSEFLTAPKPLRRGNLTAKDLSEATTTDECIELMIKWADQVYRACSVHHSSISQIADSYIHKNGNHSIRDGKVTTNST